MQQSLTAIYHKAGSLRYWRAVRYCSSLLHHIVDSISPFITTVLVNGKQLTVGIIGQNETVFDKPMTPAEIQDVMYNKVQPLDVIQAVLQQEVVLYCGRLIATTPEMFQGILKIRVGWVLEAMRLYLQISKAKGTDLDNLSPYEVRQLLSHILTVRDWAREEKLTCLQRRQLEGCLCRVPSQFYGYVWDILSRIPAGIQVQGHNLPAMPTLANMSRSELSFSLLVEEMLIKVALAEQRQLAVELLVILWTILSRNPEVHFSERLDLDRLLESAVHMWYKDNGKPITTDISPLFSLRYAESTGYLARACVNTVLQGGNLQTQTLDDMKDRPEMCKVS